MKTFTTMILAAGAVCAADRTFEQACTAVYPAAVQTMTAAHFEPAVSDAAGGILNLKYTGQPMVYNFMVKHATPYLEKYVVGGAKRKYRGLTYTTAAFVLMPREKGCQVSLSVGLAALDQKFSSATRHADAAWVRTAVEVESNGTAEREALDAIAARLEAK